MPDPNGEDYWKTHATSAPGFHRQELDDPAPEPKFKVGDHVRRTKAYCDLLALTQSMANRVGEVTGVKGGYVMVRWGGSSASLNYLSRSLTHALPPQATAVEPSKRALTLREAERMVRGQREKDYGTPEQNMGVIAALWTTYVGKTIMPHDVAAMMALLKIARIRSTSTQDSWVDLAGYAAIGSEVAL